MAWLLLTIIALTSRATYSIAVKLMSNSLPLSAPSQAVFLASVASIFAVLFSPLLGNLSVGGVSDNWITIIIMAASQGFGNVLFFRGLATLEASITQIVYSSVLIWGAILSVIFLNSTFAVIQLVGIVLLFAAIVLVQHKKKGVGRINRGVALILASALMFSIFQVTSAKLATSLTAASYLLFAYAGSAIVVATVYYPNLKKDVQKVSGNVLSFTRITLFSAITSFMYFLFSYFAYKEAPDPGVVVVLLTAQVVLSVVLGIIFLKERQQIPQKLTAAVMALIAGLLIKS